MVLKLLILSYQGVLCGLVLSETHELSETVRDNGSYALNTRGFRFISVMIDRRSLHSENGRVYENVIDLGWYLCLETALQSNL